MKATIAKYIRAGFGGLFIVSHEEYRAAQAVLAAAQDAGFTCYDWSITQGLLQVGSNEVLGAQNPIELLSQLRDLPDKTVFILRDLHSFMEANKDPVLNRMFRDAVDMARRSRKVLVLIGNKFWVPTECEKEVSRIEFKLPSKDDLRTILEGFVSGQDKPIELNGNTDAILDAGMGLTSQEFENAIAFASVETGGKDIPPKTVMHIKENTIRKNGVLEIWDEVVAPEAIGGLERVKSWLNKRRAAFSKEAKEYGLPTPKGCLLLGVPGTGKSLVCKAAAGLFQRPLLRLDVGRVMGSLVGDSERNMRMAIDTAEAVAPAILMVDELEKCFSGTKSSGQTDSGTTARVFGTFLQWLQDKTSPVFVMATCNDVTQLPPELLRRGRFEQLWFVDLPTTSERREIFSIHIKARGRNPKKYDLNKLAQASDKFTGAEIESCVGDALFSAFDDGHREMTTQDILNAIGTCVPLAKTMNVQIATLRDWAQGRCLFASEPEVQHSTQRRVTV